MQIVRVFFSFDATVTQECQLRDRHVGKFGSEPQDSSVMISDSPKHPN